MAQTNKYTSINFNHIYDKNLSSNSNPNPNPNPNPVNTPFSSSSSSATFSYSAISSANNKSHGGGRMLVLTRPTPKPISIPPSPISYPKPQQVPVSVSDPARSEPDFDVISLRPLGRTGAGGSPVLSPVPSQAGGKASPVALLSSKPDKFVPPHLRPGFAGREERPGQELIRNREMGQRYFGSPGRYGEDGGRPRSGGGHERMGRGGESDLAILNRPRSSGNRPSSSGCSRGSIELVQYLAILGSGAHFIAEDEDTVEEGEVGLMTKRYCGVIM
ncbi:proteophosphoglycan-like protein [Parasponia andersonii]|uniref:Proteophosphoglycan-like protein n=1 Tax=Parasponia andersonii TaxID=3476 RepID=A0A2P5AY62_PARAD|nr:proteophosphoglycan-like protein [Parasponia andersonii]